MTDSPPEVSVHMPVYNGLKTLPLAIQSLQVQTFSDWEAVIVDDGSSDGTADYVESIEDSRILLIRLEKNRGRAFARQTALDASRGNFICYLDSDDFYHPLKLERQVQYLQANPQVEQVGCAIGSVDADLKIRRVRAKQSIQDSEFRYVSRFPVSPAASMIRSCTAKRGQYNPRIKLGEDTDYFFRVMQDKRVANIAEVLYFYSEFESVTLRKVYSTYLYTLLALPGQFLFQPSHVTLRFFLTLMKMAVLPFLAGFKGWNSILAQRGQTPGQEDQERLAQALGALRSVGAAVA